MKMQQSCKIQNRFHKAIPGGAHTYAKGDDQFPEDLAPIIVRGKGCQVWDLDGNEYVEYGSGLRAVTLGHAYQSVVDEAAKAMCFGSNFIRPSVLELEVAEDLLDLIKGGEMVKFGKNGSDITSAAIRLSRAVTGRDMIAICGNQPFFSVDDWFIGTTAMNAGIPKQVSSLTVKFSYNDIASLRRVFEDHSERIACVILEPEKESPPVNNFLHEAQKLCRENGAVFIFDEMINGFRWHIGGGQRFHNIVPDLSAFGKALGNGFAVSALVGKRDLMERGGLRHNKERVFLLSLTHGAETHSLAAAREVMRIYREEPVIETLWRQGDRLSRGIQKSIDELGLAGHFEILGRPCCLVYATRDADRNPSQTFRTLFLQETIKRGLLATSLVVNFSHTDSFVDRTAEIIHEALTIYRKALDEGIGKYLRGRPVKPVFRAFN